MSSALARLRSRAIQSSLFQPLPLRKALSKLGFVQADPIRAPARAQDLILRHRVKNYLAGDLERHYRDLDLEENYLYAYGFMPRETALLLHPRGEFIASDLSSQILEFVRKKGPTHPRDLEADLGRERAVNGWGGFSKATTRVLESLHFYGILRVVRRENGVRIYDIAPPLSVPVLPEERLRRLVLLIAGILAPVPEPSLRAALRPLARSAPGLKDRSTAVRDLRCSGELESSEVDGVTYVWPAGRTSRREVPRRVRFLAPFDPVVWDRLRFEHFWGWPYRFEAYTPPVKRKMGYYAMPLLWIDQVIGWANLSVNARKLDVQLGFVNRRPRDREFTQALDAEVAGMETFLKLGQ
jgi:uncharacterized protein YcaQ